MKKLLSLAFALTLSVSSFSKIAIMGAMDSEIKNLLHEMKNVEIKDKAGVKFYIGELQGKDVVVFKSGVGKVNAAMSTTIAIENFETKKIIFTGVAGAVENKLNIGDVVISKDLVQHDYDTTAFGRKKGLVPGSKDGIFSSDEKLINIAKTASEKVVSNQKTYTGRIATGDQFIADKAKVAELKSEFGAWAVEMEGGAVAHVANLYEIPVVVIRSISDKADGSAHMNFSEFEQLAADNSVKIVKEMLNNL
ncbi:MAG: 5'-methylthioadenosine/adenosylhomocysteine nucleosidase [Cetobacterium sp.]